MPACLIRRSCREHSPNGKASGDAAETGIRGNRRRFESGEAATLGDRATREQGVEVFQSALLVEMLVERVVDFAQIDHRAILVMCIVVLQGANRFPVIVA